VVQRKLVPKTRVRVGDRGTLEAGTSSYGKESFSFYRQTMELRSYHKKLRVGLIVWEDVPEKYRELLQKYYGYSQHGVQL
jgi:hypothetical protein